MMKGKSKQAERVQYGEFVDKVKKGIYTPPKPKKQPTWRRSAV